MCGIAGFYDPNHNLNPMDWEKTLLAMGQALAHRGPDSFGGWTAPDGVGFSHRRLAILDLSPSGHQPMESEQFSIIFNGEIYNHLELRKRLSKPWRGTSDTETLLAAFEAWGVEETLKQAVGMFAFALWDKKNKTLHLARDRAGEKPLYYGRIGSTFFFASELKALKSHPLFKPSLDPQAVQLYFNFGFIPAPHSIYSEIKKLQPGHVLTLKSAPSEPIVKPYWELRNTPSFGGNETDALSELDQLLRRTIREQMLSDVPLGAFLSGGIDSSLVVAVMSQVAEGRVKTFTIGFKDQSYNEAPFAKKIAEHLGTDHTEYLCAPEEALATIPLLDKIYDEPFSDSSQIPTLLVSGLARKHVTVALSGDAGDELFGGYNRYIFANQYWPLLQSIPTPLRASLQLLVETAGRDSISGFLESTLGFSKSKEKLQKILSVLQAQNLKDYYSSVTAVAPEVLSKKDSAFHQLITPTYVTDDVSSLLVQDFHSYMVDDVLVKVDRAAMRQSLETRVPFLDHRIIEFAYSLPFKFKVSRGVSKLILRKLLEKYIPTSYFERPKMGFSIPLNEWLRGPLRPWAEDLLFSQTPEYLNSSVIEDLWSEHLSGKKNWQQKLWTILMYKSWLRSEELR